MAHFLIHGADKNTAENRVIVFHCLNTNEAENSASEAGIFVNNIEILDEGEEPRRNDGSSGGLLRMATKLNQQERFAEAIAILFQAFKLAKMENTELGFDSYLRLPQYLILSGKNDDAWGAFSMLKIGKIETIGNINLVPANLADVYSRMADLCKQEHSILLNIVSSVCYIISETWIGRCSPSDASQAIEKYLTESKLQFDDPSACASSFKHDLEAISPPPRREGEYDDMNARCKLALRLAHRAEQDIRDAATFK